MNLGLSAMTTTMEHDDAAVVDFDIGGRGVALDLLIGGTPAPGLVFGGAFLVTSTANPQVTVGTGSNEQKFDQDGGTSFVLLGPFVDAFPDPEGGFSIGGSLGLAGFNIAENDNAIDSIGTHESSGVGAMVWVGMGGWIGDNWSMGGLLRLGGALTQTEVESITRHANTRAIAIVFTALHH
jgi:hypothetical protein